MRTRRVARLLSPVLALVTIGALSLGGATAAGASGAFGGLSFGNNPGGHFEHHPYPPPFFGNTYTCNGANGGIVPQGNYGSMLITGTCYMPAGNITIRGDLDIAPGALLDAVTPGDPASAPAVPATVVVGGNVNVGSGAVLLFGCSPNISCSNPPAISYDRINGNLTGYGAQGVVVHSASIGGSVNLIGGGGGAAAENCSAVTIPQQMGPLPPAPWSQDPNLAFTPVYTDFEDATVGGNFNISGLTSCWLGSLRVQIGGSAAWNNNTMGDPDAMEIGSNVINGNMTCFGNSEGGTAGVQFGDGGSAPSTVGGFGLGQCGFNVLQPNPAPEALAQETPPETCTPSTCIPEHISVSKWSLGTYYGTHTQDGASLVSLPIGTTESGDALAAEVNNVVLGGSGLTGSETYDPTQPIGSTGEAVAVTTYPNGSESFTAFDNCTCTFQGQTGAVSIRAYGTVSPNGSTSGTFLVTSGGASSGGLATLAGYGTFSNWGQPAGTLGLVEHLKIT
jgi:hypothetical protein